MEGRVEEITLSSLDTRPVGARALKRGFDLVASVLGLLVLSPLLIAIAIAIKIDSRGPVLFRQPRIGRGGQRFGMLKFRTMIDGADDQKDSLRHLNEAADGLFKIRSDPRTTRIGALLRSTSLDELPQLVQVAHGMMSLVGPRPLVAEEDAQIVGAYRRRTEMRPGMTGPWQVSGASAVPINEMAELDAAYVDSWSLWGDLKLVFHTVPHVLFRRGV